MTQTILNIESKCCICEGELIYVDFYYRCKECLKDQIPYCGKMMLLKEKSHY